MKELEDVEMDVCRIGDERIRGCWYGCVQNRG